MYIITITPQLGVSCKCQVMGISNPEYTCDKPQTMSHMDAALGQLAASLQEELKSTLQPLVEQIVIQSTRICVDLCKSKLSELLDQDPGHPVDPVHTAVTRGLGPTPEEAARASAKLLVSAALLSSGVLLEAPETAGFIGFTTQATQTAPLPGHPGHPGHPGPPNVPSSTMDSSSTATAATAKGVAVPIPVAAPSAKKAMPVPKAKAPPAPPTTSATSALPVPKPKVEPRKSFAEQVAVGVSSMFGGKSTPKAKSKAESVQTGQAGQAGQAGKGQSVMNLIRKSYQAAAKSEEQPKDAKDDKISVPNVPKSKTPGRVSAISTKSVPVPRKAQRSSVVAEEDLSV